jgi:hypothetical protein
VGNVEQERDLLQQQVRCCYCCIAAIFPHVRLVTFAALAHDLRQQQVRCCCAVLRCDYSFAALFLQLRLVSLRISCDVWNTSSVRDAYYLATDNQHTD